MQLSPEAEAFSDCHKPLAVCPLRRDDGLRRRISFIGLPIVFQSLPEAFRLMSCLGENTLVERVVTTATGDGTVDDTRFLQNLKMLGHGGLCERQGLNDITAGGMCPLGQEIQNEKSGRMAKGPKEVVNPFLLQTAVGLVARRELLMIFLPCPDRAELIDLVVRRSQVTPATLPLKSRPVMIVFRR